MPEPIYRLTTSDRPLASFSTLTLAETPDGVLQLRVTGFTELMDVRCVINLTDAQAEELVEQLDATLTLRAAAASGE